MGGIVLAKYLGQILRRGQTVAGFSSKVGSGRSSPTFAHHLLPLPSPYIIALSQEGCWVTSFALSAYQEATGGWDRFFCTMRIPSLLYSACAAVFCILCCILRVLLYSVTGRAVFCILYCITEGAPSIHLLHPSQSNCTLHTRIFGLSWGNVTV